MSEDEPEPKPQTPPAMNRDLAYIAEKMPAWWRPEYQSSARPAEAPAPAPPAAPPAASAPTAPPPAPPVPAAPPAPSPAAPPAPPPAPAQQQQQPQPPISAPAPAPATPAPASEAQTMVLNVMPAAPAAILTVAEGPDRGFRFRIKPTATTHIGRENDNDVVLDDPATSRHHAEIVFHDGRYVLTDLRSANGTYVNDRRVGEQALSDGDAIRIGQNLLRIGISQ